MNNPYIVLGISQNATKQEILRAKMQAMKDRKFALKEIHEAERILATPVRRLVADFLFPSRIKSKRPKFLDLGQQLDETNITELDENAMDTINIEIP